jgi:hypothetical protein
MALAAFLQEPGVPEYVEPYNTIGTIALVALMLIYLVGTPTTVAVAAVFWGQRTRSARPAQHFVSVAGAPPAPAPPPQADPLHLARASLAAPALLHLQRVEREVLALPEQPVSASACIRLATEVEELITRYGTGYMVGRYATGLRMIVAALAPLDAHGVLAVDPPDPPPAATGAVPDELRIGLGRIAAVGRPVPARWAFAWYGHRADRWPSAADRRYDELAGAFTRRYQQTYPHGGMIVALTGGKLTLRYAPASARFGGQSIEVATDLPDVVELPDAVRRLRAVAGAALRDLDPPVTP